MLYISLYCNTCKSIIKLRMYKKFLSYIKNEDLFDKKDRILVAVSGGMDSITLCELLRVAQFDFGIAHFNHVTRNGESDLDEHFVNSYAKQYSIPYYTTKVDINKIIEEQQGGNFQNLPGNTGIPGWNH